MRLCGRPARPRGRPLRRRDDGVPAVRAGYGDGGRALNRVENIVIATAIINLPFYIRFARAEVNVRRNVGWVEAARAGGEGNISVVLRFLLPNVLPAMAVQMSLNLGWAILNAAGLSFIGLGVRPPTPEWGIMVAEGARFISTGKWWLVAFPGLALMLAVLCFNLLGDGLRDILDPRMRT